MQNAVWKTFENLQNIVSTVIENCYVTIMKTRIILKRGVVNRSPYWIFHAPTGCSYYTCRYSCYFQRIMG